MICPLSIVNALPGFLDTQSTLFAGAIQMVTGCEFLLPHGTARRNRTCKGSEFNLT